VAGGVLPFVDTCADVFALQLLLHQTTPLPSTTSLLGLEKPLLDSSSLQDGTAVQVGAHRQQQQRQRVWKPQHQHQQQR
jgi:hypothetical protein